MTNIDKQRIRDMKPDTDWYICSKCSSVGFAPKESFNICVQKRNGLCINCLEIEAREKASINRKGRVEKLSNITCAVCGKQFQGKTAKTCSKQCRKIYTEKRRFYKDLKSANIEVEASKVHVFGQGNYAVSISDKRVQKGLK